MSHPYIEGGNAYSDGDAAEVCPYEPGTEDSYLWQEGYADALAEDLKA